MKSDYSQMYKLVSELDTIEGITGYNNEVLEFVAVQLVDLLGAPFTLDNEKESAQTQIEALKERLHNALQYAKVIETYVNKNVEHAETFKKSVDELYNISFSIKVESAEAEPTTPKKGKKSA